MPRRKPLDFFEELEALDCGFFDDLDGMLRADALALEQEEAYRAYRAENAKKAHRIYPRLKVVEDFDCWRATAHIVPDFWGRQKERIKATKALHEKKMRVLWFLRALYRFWMFDIPMDWASKYMGLKYSRHRKYFLKAIRKHKRRAKKNRHVSRKAIREMRRREAEEALDTLKNSRHMHRLRNSEDDDEAK